MFLRIYHSSKRFVGKRMVSLSFLDEMLSRYERGWIHLDVIATLGKQE